MKSSTEPVWIAEVELSEPLVPLGVSRPRRGDDASVRLLIRLHRQVLGFVSIALGGPALSPASIGSAVQAQLRDPVRRHLEMDGIEGVTTLPDGGLGGEDSCAHLPSSPSTVPISVVVCTRDRPEILAHCLTRLRQLHYKTFDVVVVDNAPTTDGTRECFARMVGEDDRFRYACEPVAGLSRARNRGLAEASAKYVAFTDDDVQVDPWWLDGIAAGFARDGHAGCVTGLVPPAQLEHPAQHYFDRRYSWAAHMEPRVYNLDGGTDLSALYPYSAGIFGTGANFAVDRRLLQELGGFDEALGAGSPAGGGEDLDAFVRVLRANRTLVYDPSAVVWHVHRVGGRDQRRQLFYYGVGLTAFLSKYLFDPHITREILAKLPEGGRRIARLWSGPEISGRASPMLVAAEALGMVVGPAAYIRGRREVKRLRAEQAAR